MLDFASHPPLTEFAFVQWIIIWTCSAYGVRMWVFGTRSLDPEEWLYWKEATLCPCWNISVLHSRTALAPRLYLAVFHVKFACFHLDCGGFLLGNPNIYPLTTNMPAWRLVFSPAHICECICRRIMCIPCNRWPVLGSIAPWSGLNLGLGEERWKLCPQLSCT